VDAAGTTAGLEQDQHPGFQRWEWRLQRVGWLLLGGIVAAGLAGLLGDGPLSRRQRESSDGRMVAAFERFLHRSAPAAIELRLGPAPRSRPATLRVPSASLNQVRILRVTPEPQSERAGPDGIVFQFPLSPGEPSTIVLHVEPEQWGSLNGQFVWAGESTVDVWQYVYP
jgi:hypothetical protein